MNRRGLVLALWIAAAIFPFGWITTFSRDYARAFNAIFKLEAAHVAAHAFVFSGLACLMAYTAGGRALRGWRVPAVLGMICAVALTQEAVQLWYKRRAWGNAELVDILTDVAAACAALLVARAVADLHSRTKRAIL